MRQHKRRLPADRVLDGRFTREGAAAAAITLLERHPQLTALLVLNDAMAVAVLTALRERGIRVPRDVSVAGFDDMRSRAT